MRKTISTRLFAILAAVVLSGPAGANQQDFGDYVVYFNAFTTDVLAPEIAQAHDITRSKNRAMINVSVQKKVMETVGETVDARVEGRARNLNGQLKGMDIRRIQDGDAIYHIAEFSITDGETLDFDLDVAPEGSGQTYQVKFRKQFFSR